MTLMQCTCYGYISSCWYGNRILQYRMLPAVPSTARLCSAGPSLAAAFIAIAMACQQIIAQSAYYVMWHPKFTLILALHLAHLATAAIEHMQCCNKSWLQSRPV